MIRRPSIAPHALPEQMSVQLDPVVTRGGMHIGQEGRNPLVVRLFRSRPTQVGLFSSTYVAMVLAHRALALGAQVVVVSGRPAAWQPLVRAAPVGPAWVTVVPLNSTTPPSGTMLRPTLIVDDVGVTGGARRDLGQWQTALTLRAYVTPQVVGQLHSYDLLALQRTAAEAVGPVRAAYSLPADATQWLPRMPDDTVALASSGQMRFVNLSPTQVELHAFGKPTRQDI